MTATAVQHSEPGRQLWIPIASVVVIVISLIVLAKLAIFWLGGEAMRAGFTEDAKPLVVTLSGERLAVPANMIRFADQRSEGTQTRLDLAIHWPSMTGYTAENAASFDDVSAHAPLIFLSIGARDETVDSTTRLIGFYTRFFDGDGSPGPAGLVSRKLQPGTGYDSEEIFFQPGSTDPFSARCTKTADKVVPVTCLRDIHVGKRLSISYRFRKPILEQWRKLDPAIFMLIDKMRRDGRAAR